MSETQLAFAISTAPPIVRSRRLLQRASFAAGVPVETLEGPSRKPRLVRSRWAVMLALESYGWSMRRIGMRVGGRDSTTVLHGLRRGAELRASDSEFDALCDWVAG